MLSQIARQRFPGPGEKEGSLRGAVSRRQLGSSACTKTFAWFGAKWHNPVERIFAPRFSPWQIAQKACCHHFSPRTLSPASSWWKRRVLTDPCSVSSGLLKQIAYTVLVFPFRSRLCCLSLYRWRSKPGQRGGLWSYSTAADTSCCSYTALISSLKELSLSQPEAVGMDTNVQGL